MEQLWNDVDNYFARATGVDDAALVAAQQANDAAGLPPIAVSPNQGKFLHLLARIQGAKRVLEIGTLGGYSTIWLACALPPGGMVVTLEIDEHHATVATENIARAGLSERVELRLGPARDSLTQLIAERGAPFDLVFIDADKQGTADYFKAALELSRTGTIIIVDNVARKGHVIDADSTDENVLGMRRFFESLESETRVTSAALQTVGSKGYDGFLLALVAE